MLNQDIALYYPQTDQSPSELYDLFNSLIAINSPSLLYFGQGPFATEWHNNANTNILRYVPNDEFDEPFSTLEANAIFSEEGELLSVSAARFS